MYEVIVIFALVWSCKQTTAILHPGSARPTAPTRLDPNSTQSLHSIWAHAAHAMIYRHVSCAIDLYTTTRECRRLRRVPSTKMNVYVATGAKPGQRVKAVLPDRGLSRRGSHDAVVVLDPYPRANFGHLVIVFYVDFNVSMKRCHKRRGHIIGSNGHCVSVARKKKCKNALKRRARRRNFARRCEINFLPVVHTATSRHRRKRQRLRCRSDVVGFGACPPTRRRRRGEAQFCDPLRVNTRRCGNTHVSTREQCRPHEICDHAVLLSGGWNRWTVREHHRRNAWAVYRMLRREGFRSRNIKVFYANGAHGIEKDGSADGKAKKPHKVFPASLKMALRHHVQKLCTSIHCVDSLFFYMNSPARSDGTSLLWDVNGDGVAGQRERYTSRELLSDLADCQARQVHLLVDQSFSGELVRALRRSKNHANVVIYANGADGEYSMASDFSDIWSRANHTTRCARDVFEQAKRNSRHSTPEMHRGTEAADVTIFGAPCDISPPFTNRELRLTYRGCQNLPPALWLTKQELTNTETTPSVHTLDTVTPDTAT